MKYIDRFENEIIIFEIVFGMVHGWMTIWKFPKNPQNIPVLIICHLN
jgi:hypothetical protein